jgi:hypothetical protein
MTSEDADAEAETAPITPAGTSQAINVTMIRATILPTCDILSILSCGSVTFL